MFWRKKKDLDTRLKEAIPYKHFHIDNIVTKKSIYRIRGMGSFGIEWEDQIAELERKRRVNWQPALDENGEQKYHIGLPFGGEFGDECGGPRKYYHWTCDAIPLMCRSPRRLNRAPPDLIELLERKFDYIVEQAKEIFVVKRRYMW